MPQLTVLLAVYNGAAYLCEAIESILQQTFSDFEFLIIDDCSTDSSIEIVNGFNDKRIQLICNAENIGLAASLNKGIGLSKCNYIARMDADDISDLRRLAVQFDFMKAHPEVGVCGTWVKTFGEGEVLEWQYAANSDDIKCSLLFECPLAHPSVMLRRDVLLDNDIGYDENLKVAQDYDLWVRLSDITKFANIPSILYHYRLHAHQAGKLKALEQSRLSMAIRNRLLSRFTSELTQADLIIHEAISMRKYHQSKEFVVHAEKLLLQLLEHNMKKNIYPEPAFNNCLLTRWRDVCIQSTALGFWMFKKYYQSPFKRQFNNTDLWNIRFVLSCATYNKIVTV